MSSGPFDLSILIVSHGHEGMLPACVQSLAPAIEGLSAELIVVDNLNRGELGKLLADAPLPVSIQNNTTPLGFSANVNQAARAARGRYLLILNPDTQFQNGPIKRGIDFLESAPQAGLLGCRLLNPDLTPQQCYRRFPAFSVLVLRGLAADRWPWRPAFYRRMMMESKWTDAPQQVDWVFGACMIISRDFFNQLGGMDERFRLYYEDVDLCIRIWKFGREVWFFPDTAFVHEHLRTSAKQLFGKTRQWHLRSGFRYFAKHRSFFRAPRYAADLDASKR